MPQLVPQDRYANQLVTDEQGLLDNDRTVFLHPVHDVESGLLPDNARRLRRDGEGVHEGLRMVFANFG